MKKKWPYLAGVGLLGGISFFSFGGLNLFNFQVAGEINLHKTEINSKEPTAVEVAEAKSCADAYKVLADFYARLNTNRFHDANALLTPEYAGSNPILSEDELRNWTEKKWSDTELIEVQKCIGESTDTRKIFQFKTKYQLKGENTWKGEELRAKIVLRNGKWSIDVLTPVENYIRY
ncbi:hypothetical protein HZA45_03240 [Candidatus Peregrinibacteria bacterium]|nr:hypothetical protein [Candidatus Peregrinibacteria bacterium]